MANEEIDEDIRDWLKGGEDPTGARRETFFCHQLMSAGLKVRIPDQVDFLVENRFLFEMGGKSKGCPFTPLDFRCGLSRIHLLTHLICYFQESIINQGDFWPP